MGVYNAIIVGAEQSCFAVGYYLKQMTQNVILLDKTSEVGESWKSRYDSLTLFTPRMFDSLPGLQLKGDPHVFPT